MTPPPKKNVRICHNSATLYKWSNLVKLNLGPLSCYILYFANNNKHHRGRSTQEGKEEGFFVSGWKLVCKFVINVDFLF